MVGTVGPTLLAQGGKGGFDGRDNGALAGPYLIPYEVPPEVGNSSMIGQLGSEEEISVLVMLKPHNKERLQSFLEELSDPNSPNYRRFISPSRFIEQFSPTSEEYSALVEHFRSAKLSTLAHENRLVLYVKGSAHEFEEALGVSFSLYKRGDSLFYSAENPRLPSGFSSMVSGIVGLDNLTAIKPSYSIAPLAAGGLPPFTPQQIRSAYGVTALLDRGIDGNGQNITIVAPYGSPTLSNDLTAFAKQFSVQRPNSFLYYPLGQPASQNDSWSIETSLTVAWAGVMAPRAIINVVVTPTNRESDLYAAVNFAVTKNLGKIISLSWGGDERTQNSLFEPIFQQAVAQGIAVFVASGDCGAFAGGSPPRCDRTRRAVSYPASSQYVTAVGGTSLSLNAQDRYLQETGWNGSGGGVSAVFAMPSWQKKGGVPTSNTRILPDVAMVGDPKTGVYVTVNGKLYPVGVGGTSLSAPLMAGSFALANHLRGSNLGFASPLLYNQAQTTAYGTTIRDVVSGSNGFYQNAKGWDYVTGWGSPETNLLATSLAERLKRVTVSTSLPAGVSSTIIVDGEVYDVPAVLWLDGGMTHSFDTGPTLAASSGTRYLFAGWSGLLTSRSPAVSSAITQDGSMLLGYKTQYLLSVIGGSQPLTIWFDSNTETRAMSSYVWNEETNSSRLVLRSWQIGNTNPQPIVRQTSGTFITPPITMSAPNQVTFGSINQFFVEAITPVSATTGRGWYDSGSSATIGVGPTELDFGNGTRASFRQWTGSATGTSPTITIIVSSPKRLSAEWVRLYLLSVNSNYGVGTKESWHESGSQVIASVEPSIDQGNQTRRVFARWLGGAQGTTPVIEVLVDRPKTLRTEWRTQYFVSVTSQFGETRGSGWHDSGSSVPVNVSSTVNGILVRQVFDGWRGDLHADSPDTRVLVDSPKVITAKWRTDYIQLIGVVGVVAGIVVAGVLLRRRK